jgi:hypothetical protein
VFFEISNKSDVPFYLVKGAKDAPEAITLKANSATRVCSKQEGNFSAYI